MQGRGDEIVDLAAAAAGQFPAVPAFAAFLAQVYSDIGRHDDARATSEPLVADGLVTLRQDRGSLLLAMTFLAYAASRTGWVEASETIFDALHPFANHIPTDAAFTTGCQVSCYLGMLAATIGRLDEAEGYFSHAAAAHKRIGAEWGLAMTRLTWAEFLLDRTSSRDVHRAADMLEQAAHSARVHGYRLIERRAEHALQRLERP
jgi:hypothetical protein